MPGKLNTVMTVAEVADHIALFEANDSILIDLHHSKTSRGENASSRLADVYEVTNQVIKTTYWINRPQELLDKIKSRILSGSEYLLGGGELLSSLFTRMGESEIRYRIYVVQPGISKHSLNEEAQRVLAAASDYAIRAGTEGLYIVASD